jgi:Spermine/spermidine synthase domain
VNDGTGRRRNQRSARAARARVAVHQKVRLGAAELVPDLDRSDSWLLFIDGVPQSGVDLNDPGYLEFEYVRRIGHVADLAFPPGEPLHVLHLGGGALTLPRYLQHTRPGSRQLVAEVDDELTGLIRAHLPLAAGHRIRVRAADARAVAESVREGSYDLVVADVFAGAVTPPHLTTAEFAAATARALRPGGVYAVNVAGGTPSAAPLSPEGTTPRTPRLSGSAGPDRKDRDDIRSAPRGRTASHGDQLMSARSAVATIRSVYKETCMIAEASVLRGRRRGNLVLVGSDQPLPEAALGRAAAGDPFPARLVSGPDLARFVSGAPLVTDATVNANVPASPAPSPQSTEW